MKKSNEQSLGDALKLFLKANGLEEKVLETEIYGRWEELAGKAINLKTKRVRLEGNKLTVYLTSSVLRNELNMRRTELLERINQRLMPRITLKTLDFR
jgi:predicted nucleic acid-binding Zn ribbon protein